MKPDTVKIVQIVRMLQMGNVAYTQVLGLGDDGELYFYVPRVAHGVWYKYQQENLKY